MGDRAERSVCVKTNQLSDLVDRVFDSELPVRPNEPSLLGCYGDLRTPQLLEHPLEPGPCRFSLEQRAVVRIDVRLTLGQLRVTRSPR